MHLSELFGIHLFAARVREFAAKLLERLHRKGSGLAFGRIEIDRESSRFVPLVESRVYTPGSSISVAAMLSVSTTTFVPDGL